MGSAASGPVVGGRSLTTPEARFGAEVSMCRSVRGCVMVALNSGSLEGVAMIYNQLLLVDVWMCVGVGSGPFIRGALDGGPQCSVSTSRNLTMSFVTILALSY